MSSSVDESARTLRRDSAANRVRLVTAASRVFGERGTDTSLEEVARAAGLGLATLYRRFPTKDLLIRETVDVILEYIVGAARKEAATTDGLGLERWLRAYAYVQARKRGLLADLLKDDEWTRDRHAELTELIEKLVEDARAHGTVRADLTPSDVVLFIFAIRGVTESLRYGDKPGWRRHLDFLLASIRPSNAELHTPPWVFKAPRPPRPAAARSR